MLPLARATRRRTLVKRHARSRNRSSQLTVFPATRRRWLNTSGGIGAGMDSFYEYVLKAYVLYGELEFWEMFQRAYRAVLVHMKRGAWYHPRCSLDDANRNE